MLQSNLSYLKILKELMLKTANDSPALKSKKLAQCFEGFHFDEDVARDLILQAGGNPPERPKGIPENWKVAILPGFELRYVNPTDKAEYVEVIPGDPESIRTNLKNAKILYHHPRLVKNDVKDFSMNKIPTVLFDLSKDGKLLDDVKNHSTDLESRIIFATKNLSSYYFNLDDVQEIRKRMNFPLLDEESIDFLRKFCACHLPMISKKGGGIITHHPRHSQYSGRASRPNFFDSTYMKIQTSRGYHTQTGDIDETDSPAVHLKIQDILTMRIDFYEPPCTIIKSFSNFDYNKHKVI